MARLIFVQNIFREYPAYMALSTYLKKLGHSVGVVVARAQRNVLPAILKQEPTIVGFSPTAYDIEWCIGIASEIKKCGIEIIWGGALVTANQDLIEHPSVDFICVGEGELCLNHLLNLKDRIVDGGGYETVPNLIFKKENGIFHNPVAPMIEDLDGLGIPDHGLYDKYPQITKGSSGLFTFMRGCRFNCSFCFNHVLQNLYRNKPFVVRRRSPESSIREIEETLVSRKGAMKLVRLFDSTLLNDLQWAKEFLGLYRDRIQVPFVCFAHPTEINEEMASEMKMSGCIEVGFSIESGSSYIRNQVLRKGSSEKQLFTAAAALKRNHLPFVTFNMLGSPGESWDDIMKTVEVNIKVKPMLAWGSLTQVYRGTILENITRELDPSQIKEDQITGVLDYRHQNLSQILPLLGAFPFVTRYPKLSRKMLKQDTASKRLALRLMSFISFFMQCERPALPFKEFIRHYIFEEGRGAGYY